ncbi:MAG TPA: hypothetical protein V6D43_01540 [Candidatus Sericytochromatia bacterium]
MERLSVAHQNRNALKSHKPRNIGRGGKKTRVFRKLVIAITLLVALLLGCRSSNLGSQSSWNIYRNPRYRFEFPYPRAWLAFPMPDNRDGRAFRDPQNQNAEIRGWAGNQLSQIKTSSPNSTPKAPPKTQQQNFSTEQGLTGKLQVEIGLDISLMTLTLRQREVVYNWQGKCESKQFADYYRFFYYVASQYRLPQVKD